MEQGKGLACGYMSGRAGHFCEITGYTEFANSLVLKSSISSSVKTETITTPGGVTKERTVYTTTIPNSDGTSKTFHTYDDGSYILTNVGIGNGSSDPSSSTSTDTYVMIDKNGCLTADNAVIRGSIYATNGYFSGDIKSGSTITCGNNFSVDTNGIMEWIDGNIGSKVTMKYPACVLKGDNASGTCITISVADSFQQQDSGARMIHVGKNTKSNIISKSISKNGGNATYRGEVRICEDASSSLAFIKCDSLILDDKSKSDTFPINRVMNNNSSIIHEATVSKISEDNIFYMMSRGIPREKAIELIMLGFIERFREELPMEYAVELNQLIKKAI